MNIKDKVAIVTGASSGIGLATAKLLTQKGTKVALVARSKNKLKKVSSELAESYVVVADMSKPAQVKTMVNKVYKHYGRIDILVNNAGRGYDALVESTKLSTLHDIFKLNVIGPLVAMQAVIPIMRKQGGGVIINISSGTALMQLPNMATYSALKQALAQISLTAAKELEKDKIGVSVVYPYITNSDFEKNTIKHKVNWELYGDNGSPQSADSPEYVAGNILEAILDEKKEVFAHSWMDPRKKLSRRA